MLIQLFALENDLVVLCVNKVICFSILIISVLIGKCQYPVNQKAGELSYQLVGANPPGADGLDTSYYHFVLKMVVDCNGAAGPNLLIINNYQSNTSQMYGWTFDSASNKVNVTDPCIAFPEPPCYRVYYYHANVNLPYNYNGYSAFYADCCRDYYQNISTDFNASIYEGTKLGLTWSPMDATRPGAGYVYNSIVYYYSIPSRFTAVVNSTPVFDNSSDTVIYVCTNTNFLHTFKASTTNGDSLVYVFAPAKVFFAGVKGQAIAIQTTGNTKDITYNNPPYSATQPLGPDVTINPLTGLVQGQLHDTGSYLVTVGVFEYHNGTLVSTVPHTRDVVVKAFDCSKLPVPKAIIPPLINGCNAYTVTLPDSSTPYHPGLTWDDIQYLWSLGDGDTSQVRYPVHTYDTGTYNIRLITMPGYRCADTAYSKLLVYPSVKAAFTIAGDCTGTPVQFTNTSTTDIGEINALLWTFTNTKDSSSFSTQVNNPAITFSTANQTYMVSLDAVTNKGCDARDTQYINIWQSPYPLSPHDTVLTAGVPYHLFANAGYDSTGSYVWTPQTGLSNPYVYNPIATGTEDITYRVQMENSHGCSLTDTVHIVYYKGPDIYVPQAFTPNGDGHNDVFRPFPVGITHLDYFRVFDRWGRVVYQTETYLAGWDGTLKGEAASPGAYVWEVRGVDYNNKTVFKRGTVLLLR